MNVLFLPDSNFKWLWKKLIKTVNTFPKFQLFIYSKSLSLSAYLGGDKKNNLFKSFNTDFYKLIIEDKISTKVDWGKVKYIEKKYSISLLYDVILTDRQLGKYFYVSAIKHHHSKVSKKCSLNKSLNLCIKAFEYWENIIKKNKINLIISYGAGWGLHSRPLYIIAKKKNINIRNLVTARIRNLFYWSANEYGEFNETLKKSFKQKKIKPLKNKKIESLKNILSSSLVEKNLIKSRTFLGFSKVIIKYILLYFYRFFRNKEKFNQTQSLYEGITYLFNGYLNQKFINKIAKKVITPEEMKVSFFLPLQQVPESSTIGLSFMHDQLNFIVETSLRLPPQNKLIVKEHLYSIEARNKDFYNTIKNLPNVIFAHNYMPGEYLISRCLGVITLSSSAAYEAAIMGKPTIIFEKKPHIKELSHVLWCKHINDLKRLPSFLNKGIFKNNRKVSKMDGQIYLQRCIDNFFSISGDNLATTKKEISDFDNEKVLKSLFASLNIKYEKKVPN